MTSINDETLMAYADGELSREDCRRLEAILATDAGLRARLEPFAMTGSPLANVFGQPMREPIPERLLAVITAGGRRTSGSHGRGAKSGEPRTTGVLDSIAEALFPRGIQLAGAFGLAALVAAGGAAGYLVGSAQGPHGGGLVASEQGALVAAGDLKLALETKPSLDDQTAENGGAAVWPAASFHGREGGFCREYKIGGAGDKLYSGVACRSGDGEWRIAAHVELKEQGVKTAKGAEQQHRVAGHEDSPAVEAAVESLKQGDVLEPKDEAAAIASGWTR